jgi:hypothetical protein
MLQTSFLRRPFLTIGRDVIIITGGELKGLLAVRLLARVRVHDAVIDLRRGGDRSALSADQSQYRPVVTIHSNNLTAR